MKQLRFLLLDANIIIKLHELKLWGPIVERCEVLVAETVVKEAQYFEESNEQQERIDLSSHIDANRITVVSRSPSDLQRFREQFTPDYLERLDPGETESLAYLLASDDPCLLCSSDAIVFRILGRLRRGEQGVSLEEVFQQTGLAKPLPRQFLQSFRDHWTRVGRQEMVRGVGLR